VASDEPKSKLLLLTAKFHSVGIAKLTRCRQLACFVLIVLALLSHGRATDPLWDPAIPVPPLEDLAIPVGMRFSVIKPYEFQNDGYRFLHGVALCFHRNRLYVSFGHNRGSENTDTEEARWSVSDDQGRTWSPLKSIDEGTEPGVGVSHGAFLSHADKLWAFQGAYQDSMQNVHTRAYVFNEADQRWIPQGTIIEQGFWPMQEPIRMPNGNWIMAGLKVGGGNPAIVAISQGPDLLKWTATSIPTDPMMKMWGESTVIVQGSRILNIARYGAAATALLALSNDYGLSWTNSTVSNLPMATSKPYAGTLSNGQNYLICTTTANSGSKRAPLTIAVTRPGETLFSRVFKIRDAVFPEGPGESHPKAALAYPYAIEHAGYLYVGYSNSGGGIGRIGQGRELANNNSAELAVIPISSLAISKVTR